MAVNIDIYSEEEEKTKRVTLDFNANILAPSGSGYSSKELEYYFVMNTTARDTNNDTIPVKVMNNLATSPTGGVAAYPTVTDMVEAYTAWFTSEIDFSR